MNRQITASIRPSLPTDLQNIKRAYVNIHDFVRIQKAGGDVSKIKFRSYSALQGNICSDRHRRFPLHRAKADELLAAMLITL
jgi:hypothetical protein